MRLATKLIAAALVGSASLAAAVPAHAQYNSQWNDRYGDRDDDRRWNDRYDDRRYDDRGRAQALRAQIQQIEYRVQRNDWRDRISEREANAFRRTTYDLRRQYNAYARDGFSQREFQILQGRVQQLRQRLGYERRDDDRRRW